MALQYTPYTVPLILGGISAGAIAVFVLRRRHSPEAGTIALLMLAVGFWSLVYALQIENSELGAQVFWSKVQYLGIVSVPTCWFVFTLQYAGRGSWLTRRNIGLLLIEPFITLLLVWTNQLHGLIWNHYGLERLGSFLIKSSGYGPWFRVHSAYSYSLVLFSTALILETLLRSRGLYRKQAAVLLVFSLLPWAGNLLYLLKWDLLPLLDLTLFAFLLTIPVLAWGLFRYRLGDLIPIAHESVIRSMNDSVIVLDEQNRIVELNPAAQKMMDYSSSKVIGESAEYLLADLLGQLDSPGDEVRQGKEVTIGEGDQQRIFDVRLSPLTDWRGRIASRVLAMRDITARKRAADELQRHREQLEQMVQERTSELGAANEKLLQEIKERKRVEETLLISEARYRRILDSSHDMISVVDENNKALFTNKSFHDTSGYMRGEVEEIDVFDLVHPEDRQRIKDLFWSVMRGDPVRSVEYRGIPKDGKTRWIESNADPIDWPGAERAVLNVMRDVTERKQIEQALRESEERYRTLVDNSLTSICVIKDGRLQFTNKRFADLSGYTEDELIGRRVEQLVHPDDRKLSEDIMTQRLAGKSTSSYQFRGLTKDSAIRWLESLGAVIDYQGGPAILVNLIDITDRKRAEEALRESEQRYRTYIEEAKDIIYTIDLETNKVSSANNFGLETLGYTWEEILERENFLEMVHPDEQEMLIEAMQDRITGNRTPNFPFRMRKSEGTYIDVEQNGAVILNSEGKPVTYLGIARDVTERKRMEEAVRLSEERYRQILDSSHDMILVADEDETVLFANNAFQTYMDYTVEDVNEMGVFATMHPDDREAAQRWFRRLIAGEFVRNITYRLISRNGDIRWVESNADPIRWPGVEKAVVNVARDVSGRKQAEEALKESEGRYRTLVSSSLTGIYVIQEGKIRFVNDRLLSMSGYREEELVGIPMSEMVYHEDREYVEEVTALRILGEIPPGHSQFRVIFKNGDVRWVETFSSRINFQGKPALMVNQIDITERKEMEEALRESEQKFRSLVEITSDWVWETDPRGIYTYASPKSKDLLGYEPEEVVGKSFLDFMTDDDRERAAQYLSEVVESQSSFAGLEKNNFHKKGRVVVLESGGVPFFDSEGNLMGYRGIDRDITDRKRADEALRISEERYRNIFEEAPDIFYVLDLDTWIITDANKYALEALEYNLDRLGNTHVSEILHPDDFERATNRLKEMVIKRDRMPDFPLRILTSTGKVRHIEQRGVILWENGHAKSFLGLAHDVTHRKKQEEMIQKRNEKLAALYEAAKAANSSLELNTVIELIIDLLPRLTNSDAACIYGYDEETQTLTYRAHRGFSDEAIRGTDGLKLGEGLHGHVAMSRSPLLVYNLPKSSLPANRPHMSREGFDSALIVPLMARDKLLGTLTVVRKPGNPYDTEDLELMTAIANQVVVAMENANLYLRILERENHLQSIIQTSLDGIVATSDEQRVVYRNSALSAMFGYSDDDVVDDTDTIHYFAPESHSVLFWIRDQLNEGKTIDQTINFKARRKDGSTFDAELRLGNFYEKGKRYDVGIVRDVTERKRMEFQLLQSSKLAAIGELAAGVAHEINNPISAIDVQTGLIQDIIEDEKEKLDRNLLEQLRSYLNIVGDQVHRCQSVTNDLLSFSRVPDSKEELFAINDLLRKTADLVIHLSEKKPKLQMVLDDRIPLFRGDPNRLEQVFVNLLSNALKAIDSNGSITVATHLDEGGGFHIEFKDSGPGMPKEISDRIFDPFFTTRPEGEGTGLGLSISYYIIKEMNGSLDVESSPGQGTLFRISFGNESKSVEGVEHVS